MSMVWPRIPRRHVWRVDGGAQDSDVARFAGTVNAHAEFFDGHAPIFVARAPGRLDDRSQVRDPSVMPHQQLVQLTTGRDVLILEHQRSPGLHRSENSLRDLVVDGREHVPRARKETGEPTIPLRDGRRARRPRGEQCARSGNAVESLSSQLSVDHPECVTQMLLQQRDLGLDRELDVGERRRRPAVRRHAGEYPRGPLLIHQATGAVDRIDDDPELDGIGRVTRREHELACRAQSLGHEHEGPLGRQLAEPLDQNALGHAIDRVNRVAPLVA